MAEEAAPATDRGASEEISAEDMELAIAGESKDGAGGPDTNGKRDREEEGGGDIDGLGNEEDGASKKQKVVEDRPEKDSGLVKLGAKEFGSSVEMFDYFFRLLHAWPTNLNVNKYEHMMLLDLIKKGHAEAERKIGPGVKAFQVRFHPMFQSKCFFLIREDKSVDDFSFRKCVDHIVPLPDHMKVKPVPDRTLGRTKGRGGGHRGRGRGSGRS